SAARIRIVGRRRQGHRFVRLSAMSPREIFHAALAVADPARRSAYLDEACAGNPTLRAHIEGLLELEGQLGSFLESPGCAPAATVDEPIRERPGTVIGPYKLLQQI